MDRFEAAGGGPVSARAAGAVVAVVWAATATLAMGLAWGHADAAVAQEPKGEWSQPKEGLNTPRSEHGATRLPDGRVLVAGGAVTDSAEASAEIYDPNAAKGERWELTDPMNEGQRSHEMVALARGRVLVIGGRGGNFTFPAPEIYDPGADEGERWTRVEQRSPTGPPDTVAVMDGSRCDGGGPQWCGKVLAVSSAFGNAQSALMDPSPDTAEPRWTRTDQQPNVAHDEVMVQLDAPQCKENPPEWCGRVLKAGENGSEVYDPDDQSWQSTEEMNYPRRSHTLTLLSDGRVLAVGDAENPETDDPEAGKAEIFDPNTEKWRETGELLTPRPADHTATRLQDGTVLVTGGRDGTTDCLAHTERFYPQRENNNDGLSGKFVSAGDMGKTREAHTATLLEDGGMLVVGGPDCLNGTTIDLYEPGGAERAPRIDKVTPNSGVTEGGATVTITGAHFADVEQVTFGDNTVSKFEVQGSTEIEATVPPRDEPGSVRVGVKTQAGEDESDAAFTYVAPAGLWAPVDDSLPSKPRYGVHAVGLGGGDVLAVYEEHTEDPKGEARAVVYDPARGSVDESVADPPIRPDFAVPLKDGRALVAREGNDRAGAVYDPDENAWQETPTPPGGPHRGAVLEDGRVLTVPSFGDGVSQVYNPERDQWRATAGQPTEGRQGTTLTRLGDGRVLRASGGGSNTQEAEIFDPATEQWSQAAELTTARDSHEAVGLADGRVLVAGGSAIESSLTASVELFDAGADGSGDGEGSWEIATPMSHARLGHTLTRLADGSVLAVGGGRDTPGYGSGEPLRHAALYRPDSDRWQPTGLLGHARSAHAAVGLDKGCGQRCGGVVVIGGSEGPESLEVYMPRPQVEGVDPAGGVVGSEVTIAGRFFAGVDSVVIGGKEADFSVEARDEIVATVPEGLDEGPAEVEVTTEVAMSDGEVRALSSQEQATVTVEGGAVEGEVGPVEDLEASTNSDTEVGLEWSAVADGAGGVADEYVVAQSLEPIETPQDFKEAFALCGGVCGGFKPAPQAVGDSMALSVTELTPGTKYYYAIAPIDASDQRGPISDWVSATTSGEKPPEGGQGDDGQVQPDGGVGPVEDLEASTNSDTEVGLEWSAVADGAGGVADEYVVAQSLEPIETPQDFKEAFALCGGVCGGFKPAPQAVGDSMALSVTELTPGTKYYYAIAPIDASGQRGPISDWVSATTSGEKPPEGGQGDDGQAQPDGDGERGDGSTAGDGQALRMAGGDRIATAVAASQEAFDAGQAGGVVLARADEFADALAGVPFADVVEGPLLLTHSDGLDQGVAGELQRVLGEGGAVWLLGGNGAVSQQVEQRIAAMGYEPKRLAGRNRFETAAIIAEFGLSAPDRALLATGGEFADAVTAGAAAAHTDAAVLLTAGDKLPPATAQYLQQQTPSVQHAVGGPAAAAAPQISALVGATRYETAATVAEELFDQPATAGLATGTAFPDSLTGGAHIAGYGAPMLLSPPDGLHPAAADYLTAQAPNVTTTVLYGGPAALNQTVADGAKAAVTTAGS